MDKRLEHMRLDLKLMARAESMRLFRVARRAEEHGVSKEIINNIREEAFIMLNTMTAYPERLIMDNFEYNYKYAFRY